MDNLIYLLADTLFPVYLFLLILQILLLMLAKRSGGKALWNGAVALICVSFVAAFALFTANYGNGIAGFADELISLGACMVYGIMAGVAFWCKDR